MSLRINHLDFRYTAEEALLFKNFSLEIPEKSIVTLLGPSGCGKTTLLKLIAGLLHSEAGAIEGINGRAISYLFQEPRLLPWRTVAENLDIVLKNGVPNQTERAAVVAKTLAMVGLGDAARQYPATLSGGMRQRVALARAFAFPSEILLLDEPFQALDLRRKIDLLDTFRAIWIADPRTAVFVTHDIQEALILGDRIIVLDQRPLSVVHTARNPVPLSQRSPDHPAILALETELYRVLLEKR